MIYLVVGPGRTGSLLLCHLLSSNATSHAGGLANAYMSPLDTSEYVYKLYRRPDVENLVIHSHDPNIVKTLNLPAEKVMLIMSKRKDVFRTAVSHYITYQTKEWHDYTNQLPVPVVVGAEHFIGTCVEIKNWYNKIDLNFPFFKVTEIDYDEIFIDNYAVVKERLELKNPGEPGTTKNPSPYNYKDWISNWQELEEVYSQLEKGS